MNIFTLAVLIGVLTILLGALFMWMIVSLSGAVVANELTIAEQEKIRKSVTPEKTGGFSITQEFSLADQLNEARVEAAKRAARLKRGENMGIGRSGTVDARQEKKTVSAGITEDPLNALKIAQFHSWDGLQYVKGASTATAATSAAKIILRKILPGQDYKYIPLAGLSGAEKRAAAIANAKAKAVAYAELKAAGKLTMSSADVAPAAAAAPAAPVAAAPEAAAPSVELPESPVLTVITPDMDKATKKAAKLANVKAKSAYKKQLKAAGIDLKLIEWTETGAILKAAAAPAAPAAAPVAAPAPAKAAAPAPAPAAELPPPPQLIEITDDMSKAEKGAAKRANIKARSAYKKQLRAMGLDPKLAKF